MINEQAESTVISGILQYGSEAYNDIACNINDGTFCDENNKVIFTCMEEIFKDNPDAKIDISLLNLHAARAGYKGFFDNDEVRNYVAFLKKEKVEYESIRKSAAVIRKLQIARILKDQMRLIDRDLSKVTGFESAMQILGMAQEPLFNLTELLVKDAGAEVIPIGSNLKEYVEYLINNPVEMLGISSGFPVYDAAIGGGFRRKTVNLFGARSKVGKSFLVDNIALNLNKRGIPVLNLDTEMTKEDHIHRILANMSGVPTNNIERGKLNEVEKKLVRDAAKILESLDYHHVCVAGKPFEEIISIARRWVQKTVGKTNGQTNDCLIMYDYFKLMSADGLQQLQEYQALGFQATTLHNFSVLNDVPVMATIQLNRDGVNKESAEVISQSDRILWLVTNFSLYKKKSPEEMLESGSHGNRKLLVLAARHGSGLEDDQYINYQFDGHIGRITERKLNTDVQPSSTTDTHSGFAINGEIDPQL